jgi:chaperonin GroEL
MDIAALTGANLVSGELGATLNRVSIDDLGQADRVTVAKEQTTILTAIRDKERLTNHVSRLRAEIAQTMDAYEREKLQLRLSKLVGKFATIHVAASTDTDINERRYRAESAMHSARCAYENGCVAGGGRTLLAAQAAIERLVATNDAESEGFRVVSLALEGPLSTLIENAGRNPTDILPEIRSADPDVGFDSESESVRDLREAGVLDCGEVLCTGLRTAFSHARAILETDRWELQEPSSQ